MLDGAIKHKPPYILGADVVLVLLAGGVILVAVLVLSTFFMAGSAAAKDSEIMEFSSMVGVPRPYTGAANAIRGVPGGGRPWEIGAAEGELKANGKLEVEVRGLVIDPNEPVATAGTNPRPTFRVIVSCMSTDATGAAVVSNVMTAALPCGCCWQCGSRDKIDSAFALYCADHLCDQCDWFLVRRYWKLM